MSFPKIKRLDKPNLMKKYTFNLLFTFFSIFILTSNCFSQTVDFSGAKIVCFEKDNKLVLRSVSIFQEEIKNKCDIMLPVTKKLSEKFQNVIFIGSENDLIKLPEEYRNILPKMESTGNEGYKIIVSKDPNAALIIGHDPRGVLYGVGKLLRKMELRKTQLLVPEDLKIASTPKYPIRGHQLGYRPKTNAYDAWTPQQYDRYIRDLAIFGANSIEIMPPGTDDDFSSVNMKLPAIEMIREQSKICDSYGMDVWMWYPNMGSDYVHPDSIKKEIEERRNVFKTVSRLDHVFVPAGDPGELEPDVLFEWLKIVAEVLHEYHPNAKIWVSPQVFRPSKQWFDSFFKHVNNEYSWFGGVVFGPWVKIPIKEIRERINPNIQIRRYPDITHSLSCQYPIPQLDLAFAVTLGRECINPRPIDEKIIHNAFDQYSQGSISYSEGINDDVNKIVWSDQDWNPETPVIETLRDYARYFIGPDYTESVAQGFMAEEKNLQGPLLVNDGISRTLNQWQQMEKSASTETLSNPRFQMGLMRAYYDAYEYNRLIYETGLEQKAREILSSAEQKGSKTAIREARETLSKAWEMPVMNALRERCFALADSLYRSIGAQLTVEKHHAMSGRGNFIDNIDLPLNDAMWLLYQLGISEKFTSENERLQAIEKILQRNNPGLGGFYDNFGSPKSWARVKSDVQWQDDPGNLASPREGFGIGLQGVSWVHKITGEESEGQAPPISWMNQVTTLYDQPLVIRYDNLDPKGQYSIRVTYTGRFKSKMKMVADDILVHDFIRTGIQPIYEFPVPAAAVADGIVEFKWTCGEGERGSQVSEIWLMRKE